MCKRLAPLMGRSLVARRLHRRAFTAGRRVCHAQTARRSIAVLPSSVPSMGLPYVQALSPIDGAQPRSAATSSPRVHRWPTCLPCTDRTAINRRATKQRPIHGTSYVQPLSPIDGAQPRRAATSSPRVHRWPTCLPCTDRTAINRRATEQRPINGTSYVQPFRLAPLMGRSLVARRLHRRVFTAGRRVCHAQTARRSIAVLQSNVPSMGLPRWNHRATLSPIDVAQPRRAATSSPRVIGGRITAIVSGP